MATFTNESKSASTFKNFLRHATDTVLEDIANFTFEDVIFPDGTKLQDVTFEQLTAQVWSNVSKNSSSFSNATRN